MITIFHLIALFTAISGLLAGIVLGLHFYGCIGGCIGAILGVYAGLVTGRLPGFFAHRAVVRSIRAKATSELRAMLRGKNFALFHLVLAELTVRGENIQSERMHVLNLLVSEVYAARLCGWKTLCYFFPEDATQIAGYQPKAPVEECQAKARKLGIE